MLNIIQTTRIDVYYYAYIDYALTSREEADDSNTTKRVSSA